MKKFYCFILIFLAITSCFVFSACGDKYSNLSMEFYNHEGEAITSLNLVIGGEEADLSEEISVSFSGIDEDEIGSVVVQSSPSELVTISDYVFDGNKITVTATANMTGSGSIVVRHLSSGKTSSISLTVDQLSTGLSLKTNTYVVSIPSSIEDTYSVLIDSTSLVSLLPSKSTDKIYFKAKAYTSYSGITFETISIDENDYITGFVLDANTVSGTTLTLYPVTYVNGYAVKEYESEEITFVFVDTLTAEEVYLETDGYHQPYLDASEVIYLIANDTTATTDGAGVSYSYNNFQIAIKQIIDSGSGLTYADLSENYSNYYKIECVSSNSAIDVMTSGDYFIIRAGEYTSSTVAVTITLSPNNCAGDLPTITKTFYVKGEAKAETISAYFQGDSDSLDLSENVDIYNYYTTSGGSSLGALFNFVAGVDTNYADLKSMRIVVSAKNLNAFLSGSETIAGVNSIYTDSTFSTLATESDILEALSNVRTNQFVLEFYLGNEALKFYFDMTSYSFVSEEITDKDKIYIKYSELENYNSTGELSITIQTYYTGDLTYLKDIEGVEEEIYFTRQEGVASMTVNAGNLTSASSFSIYQDADGKGVEIESVYLNVLDAFDTELGTNYDQQYLLYISNLVGENDLTITNATFEVSVVGASENSLKIVQFNGAFSSTLLSQASETITFSTSATTTRNVILLVFDATTTCGNYTLTFSAGNGFTKSIKVFVFKDVGESDVYFEIETNDSAFSNVEIDEENEEKYIFADYEANYIVASGSELELEILLSDIVEYSIITGYSVDLAWVEETSASIEDYLTVTMDKTQSNLAILDFLQGSYFNEKNNYIKLSLNVEVKIFDSIINDSTSTKKLTISFTVFIYDEITVADVSLSDTNLTVYMNDLLGAYYINSQESIATISVSVSDENLWNYVQSYVQNSNYGIGDAGSTHKVIWYTNVTDTALTPTTLEQGEFSISLFFASSRSSYYYDIYFQVQQFNKTITLPCRVIVNIPIITESLVLNSAVEDYDDGSGSYINLKLKDAYTVDVTSVSSLGTVSNPDIYLLVVDSKGNVNNSAVSVNNATLTITVDSMATSLKLIILAKDALSIKIDNIASGFNDLDSILMDENSISNVSYKNAYIIIDLILSDGTEDNPYLILDADDFYGIVVGDDSDGVYYKIMNDIDLSIVSDSSLVQTLTNFKGTITTYYTTDSEGEKQNYTFSLYGIILNASMKNVFDDFYGNIEYVNFIVTYNYKIVASDTNSEALEDFMLGVFGQVNNGATLTNVTAEISGETEINASTNVYFGGLVGYNDGGTIQYTENVIGIQGEIKLTGSATVYFGGLVGYNRAGTITGYSSEENSSGSVGTVDYIFDVYIDNSGSISSLDIISEIDNSEAVEGKGGIGGIAGFNSGRITSAYVSGTITASGNNVGGAVGVNWASTYSVTLTIETNGVTAISLESGLTESISDVTSTVQIKAKNYVGGIVGYSEGGYFTNNRYQILASYSYGLSGNNYVGGIAGYSNNGIFQYCSVMSYRWDYSLLRAENEYKTFSSSGEADISGSDYVAGIVGGAKSEAEQGISSGNYKLVTIISSSANAYISGTSDLAGIVSNIQDEDNENYNISIALNTYFIGRVEVEMGQKGETTSDGYVLVSNDKCTEFNMTYTVVLDSTNTLYVGSYNSGTSFDIGETSDIDNSIWSYDSELNGGYIYLLDESGAPLFEIAPTSLTAKGDSNSGVLVSEDHTNFIHLNYYAFDLDTLSDDYDTLYDELTEQFNTHEITDIIKFTCLPSSLTSVRLYVASSNSSIIKISGSKIIVCGVGQATLTFTSALNNNVTAKITVEVTYPMGSNVISESAADRSLSIAGSTQNITKGDAKLYYIISSGTEEYNGEDFSFTPNSDLYLLVTISGKYKDDSANVGKSDIINCIQISGLTWTEDENGKLYVLVSPSTPFSVGVNNHLENAKFTITIEPYILLTYNGNEFEIKTGENFSFDVVTYQGATDLSLSYDAVTLYPNDTTIVTAYITSDIELSEEWENLKNDVFKELTVQILNEDGTVTTVTDSDEISKYVSFYLDGGYNSDDGIHTLSYKITFYDKDSISTQSTLRICFVLTNGTTKYVEFTVLPQRINKIEIKNYIYDDDQKSTITSSSVLRPTSEGLIIIDIAPINGYYDYLEISDVTGNEEIVFAQISGVGGARLSSMDEASSDGKGIVLKKVENTTSIYVSTRISSNYTSKTHTIRVTAYLSDGTEASETFYFQIEAKMLPTISVEYVDPNGDTVFDISATSATVDTDTHYLANAVDANFYISTSNSDGNLDITLTLSDGYNASTYYSLYEVRSGYYVLKYINSSYNSSLLGKTLTITLSTTATQSNGDFETTTITFTFTIVRYVIHNISVSHSKITDSYGSDYVGEIYGDYYADTDITFYLKATDISFYDTEYGKSTFWETIYNYKDMSKYSEDADDDDTDEYKALHEIYLLLYELNNFVSDSTKQAESETTIIYKSATQDTNITLTISGLKKEEFTINGNTLKVYSGSGYLNLSVELYLNKSNNFSIYSTGEVGSVEISNKYYLHFTTSNSFEEPTVIYSAEEFLAMESGDEVYYILATDISLDNYTPLDVDIRSFDGNGHTITINSFAFSSDDTLSLGLFSQVYKDMMILNLRVVYNIGSTEEKNGSTTISYYNFSTSSSDSSESSETVEHSAIYFGGITPTNNGIISNCEVSGTLAISTDSVVTGGTDKSINIFVGGITEDNATSGYITNSTSSLKTYGVLNAGGVAYTNSGKIVSSAFDGGVIYSYSTNTVYNTIIVNVGGFVYENSGEISMSYVDLESVKIGTTTYGALSVKDTSAGFVYINSGTVYDCYVDISLVYGYNNTFAGFVYSNSGRIKTSYSYVNSGNRNSQIVSMFAPSGTTGITDSYEIVTSSAAYTSGVSGLTTLTNNIYLQSSYEGFNFGDNSSSVWTIGTRSLPLLVSTLEKVELNGEVDAGTETTDGENTVWTYSSGLRIIERTRIATADESGHYTYVYTDTVLSSGYGSENNPYLIYDVDTWEYYFNEMADDEGVNNKYFRIITDIDFSSTYSNVATSNLTFSGNIQGNNMTLSGITLYSASSLESIGLFKQLIGANDISITNSVRNLVLQPTSILAARTTMVGVLAGLVEDFNLYNIQIDASSVILVGGNAVGGVAGVVRGNFDIEGLSSNVGANSNRNSSGTTYTVYVSTNNGEEASSNISSVYYAGCVIGILDGYSGTNYNVNNARNLATNTYFSVKDVTVSGNCAVLGDTVGGAFGFVGERVYVSNVTVEYSGALSGDQYSGGIAGENRGVIENATFSSTTSALFTNSGNVVAGIVGFNLGGFVDNASSSFNFTRTTSSSFTVGGVVGRNVNGYIRDASFDGEILAYYTGGIIGADYSSDKIVGSSSSSAGTLTADSQSVVPTDSDFGYFDADGSLVQVENVSVSLNTLNFWFENMSRFYYYDENQDDFTSSIRYLKVLGLAVGITDTNKGEVISNYGYDKNSSRLVFNVEDPDAVSLGAVVDASLVGDVNYTLPYSNIITSISNLDYTYVTYIVGATVESFDTWTRASYGTERLVFLGENASVDNITLTGSSGSSLVAFIQDDTTNYTIRVYSSNSDSSGNITFTIHYSYLDIINSDSITISATDDDSTEIIGTASNDSASVSLSELNSSKITLVIDATNNSGDEVKETICFTIYFTNG